MLSTACALSEMHPMLLYFYWLVRLYISSLVTVYSMLQRQWHFRFAVISMWQAYSNLLYP